VEVSASTRLLAVIGDPVAHSVSPAMHNAAFRVLGLDAVYVALRTPAAALPSMLAALATVGAAGNVTVPHKEAVERCVARKTELCAQVGACNTFWTEHGALVGDNTDVAGIQAALRQLGADGGGTWLLTGTGGAARAVAVAAAAAKADLHVLSRDAARARAFADWARGHGVRAAPARGVRHWARSMKWMGASSSSTVTPPAMNTARQPQRSTRKPATIGPSVRPA